MVSPPFFGITQRASCPGLIALTHSLLQASSLLRRASQQPYSHSADSSAAAASSSRLSSSPSSSNNSRFTQGTSSASSAYAHHQHHNSTSNSSSSSSSSLEMNRNADPLDYFVKQDKIGEPFVVIRAALHPLESRGDARKRGTCAHTRGTRPSEGHWLLCTSSCIILRTGRRRELIGHSCDASERSSRKRKLGCEGSR